MRGPKPPIMYPVSPVGFKLKHLGLTVRPGAALHESTRLASNPARPAPAHLTVGAIWGP